MNHSFKMPVTSGTSLVVQWLRLRLPMQRVRVQFPGQRAKILYTFSAKKKKKNQNIKEKQYCNNNKDFKRDIKKI